MSKLQSAVNRLKQEGGGKFLARAALAVVIKLLEAKRAIRWRLLRLKLPKNDGLIARPIHGSRMYLSLADAGLSKDLLLDGTREPFATALIQRELKPGMTVADVGANIGYYALLEAKLVGPTGKVIAVEPVPENLALLRKNVELNQYKNVETHHGAMGDSDKQSTIYVAERRNSSSMMHDVERDIKIVKEEPVHEYTFDSFFAGRQRPDLVRMDVEGYERNIIRGMKGIIADGKPLKILLEFHAPFLGKEGVDEILNTMLNNGFSIAEITIERSKLVMAHRGVLSALFDYCNRVLGTGEVASFVGTQEEKRAFLHTPNFFQVLFVRS